VLVTGTRHPVVLLSPAKNGLVAFYTGLAEELASRGYVVAGVDSTFEATAVEFPGGRVEVENPDVLEDNERLLTVRTADMRFVLERLTAVAAGGAPTPGTRWAA
jgi:predicted dienelactone hydrolase